MTQIICRADQRIARSRVPQVVQGSGHVPGEIARSRARAAQILLNARTQAREILASAKALGMAESQKAWELGYQGGLAQAQSEQASITDALSSLVAGAAGDYEQNLRNLDRTAQELVIEVVRAVLHREVSTSPDVVLDVVRAGLRELSTDTTVAARVNPADVGLLDENRLHLGLPSTVTLNIIADSAIAAGGCIIESGSGRVDATLEKQLARIRENLDDHLSAC